MSEIPKNIHEISEAAFEDYEKSELPERDYYHGRGGIKGAVTRIAPSDSRTNATDSYRGIATGERGQDRSVINTYVRTPDGVQDPAVTASHELSGIGATVEYSVRHRPGREGEGAIVVGTLISRNDSTGKEVYHTTSRNPAIAAKVVSLAAKRIKAQL